MLFFIVFHQIYGGHLVFGHFESLKVKIEFDIPRKWIQHPKIMLNQVDVQFYSKMPCKPNREAFSELWALTTIILLLIHLLQLLG